MPQGVRVESLGHQSVTVQRMPRDAWERYDEPVNIDKDPEEALVF
jgi:hypothetical protein